jgi:subtilisin-like proprotein convertase family protein
VRYLLIGVFYLICAGSLFAQPRNFDFLRRMDSNRNGRLESSEISDRARPYLERFAREAGFRLSGSVSIGQLESAARRYYARRGDSSQRSGPSGTRSFSSSSIGEESYGVRDFGPDKNTLVVPGFGPDVDIRYAYTIPDDEEAAERLARYDVNKDGGIDRAEAARGRWSDNPFAYDFNEDGLLSRIELAQRYARRRIAQERERSRDSRSDNRDDRDRDDDQRGGRSRSDDDRRQWDSRRYGSSRGSSRPDRRTYELAYSIVARHDRNRNGNLERPEWVAAGENIAQADEDRDGQITRGELANWLSQDIQRKYKDFSADLPPWFFELDQNGDRQVSMSEFTTQWTAEKLTEFAEYDSNDDGFLTEKELLESKSAVGGTFANEKAMVILPAGTVVSEIVVDEDFVISDLNLKLSITHTNAQQLNAYLIGPDEVQVELFTGVGRTDDHFDGTVFDDEASERITRARPPFRGSFLPEAVEKKRTSLSHFYGKSIRGRWQLEIRTSNGDRPGMLHGWSLIVRRPDQLDSDAVVADPAEEENASSTGADRGEGRDGRPPGFGESGSRGPPRFGNGWPPPRDRSSFGGGRPSYRRGDPSRGRPPDQP